MSAGALTAAAAALAVDWTRCDGHGLCAQLLPSRIALDEWGFPILPEQPLDPRVHLGGRSQWREGQQACVEGLALAAG